MTAYARRDNFLHSSQTNTLHMLFFQIAHDKILTQLTELQLFSENSNK